MNIASVASALPRYSSDQRTLTNYLREMWGDWTQIASRIDGLHENVLVERRHHALPLEKYAELKTFGQFNDAWITAATDLGEQALRSALERANLGVRDVDAIVFSSVTGVSSPSIDARLVNRMGLRTDVKRMPLFGLGCVAGAAAVARAADLVRGEPRGVVAALTVELCSLTLQREDRSIANVIASGLFGDGATCALVVGSQRAVSGPRSGPRIRATRSVFYPDTEDVMGWSISERGFRIVLSPAVPAVAREHLGRDVDEFLADQGLKRSDIGSWVCHPGGPKVLAAARDALGATDEDLALSWESLREAGNLSSASVLLILEKTIQKRRPKPGTLGMMLAMGPGFCSELILLEW